jgi:hypothetical protein
MASLSDLFNPTFLMFLGILVLVSAMMVVYFESKLREQNHKITSMFSLVSTLAEDMNNIRITFGHTLNQIDMQNSNIDISLEEPRLKLIPVSDDEEDETDDEDDREDENESEDEDENEDEDEDEGESENDSFEVDENCHNEEFNIKVLKINSNEENDTSNLVLNEILEINEEDNKVIIEERSNIKDDTYIEEFNLDENDKEKQNINLNDGSNKIIHIDLEDNNLDNLENLDNSESIDYKKMSLQKLKNIVQDKKLSNDVSKLKKHELLKLLGIDN